MNFVKPRRFKGCNAVLLIHTVEDVIRLPGVISVHEVHVWELVKDRNVATLHVNVNSELCNPPNKTLHVQIRDLFHKAGIHSVTIQLEASDGDLKSSQCINTCTSTNCLKLSCCPVEPKSGALVRKKNWSQSSGDVSVDMVDGTNNLLRERDTKQLDGKTTAITKF